MTPEYCEENCPKKDNCGFTSPIHELHNLIRYIFKEKRCPCSECIVIMKCGTQTGRQHLCRERSRIFDLIETEIMSITQEEKKRRKENDILHKRSSSVERQYYRL